jgi:two-component system CheB/CheR fusion protein
MKSLSPQVSNPHISSTLVTAPLFPIVGIGASAGGLEALEALLSHVPVACGMSFVIVQHLSPDHVGNLPEILQRCTTMQIQQAIDNTPVLPNCVYIIPPNKDMTINKRTLHLRVPLAKHGLRLPIDIFLRSLADDSAEQSIGVILSGMGSDGTPGLCAIKEQGGLTVAQEPGTAKFDSMPNSAIAAGCVAIIAPPEEIAERIIGFLGGVLPTLPETVVAPVQSTGTIFEQITALLKAKTGHDFSLYKQTSVFRRIERRMDVHKIVAISDYVTFLRSNQHEVELLFKELLIGVTSFFRDPAMWDELQSESLPKILATLPEGGLLRAWSCGCSTGEEAYSLAIAFREVLDTLARPDRYKLQIFATDLDVDAIEKARKGSYPAHISTQLSPARLKRFFVAEDNSYRVCKEIREMVTFARHNAIMDPPFIKLDILICRNLLIYLTSDLQKKLMPLFHFSLKPGGLLFLGNAETISPLTDLFAPLSGGSKLFWRSKNSFTTATVSFPTDLTAHFSKALHQESLMLNSTDNFQLLADHLILQHFSAPTVLVNEHGDIVYISGRTGAYLEPAAGKANMNIFAMARTDLRFKLASAFGQVLRQSEPLTVRAELSDPQSPVQAVDISLLKIEAPEALQGMVMIAFKDVILPAKSKRKKSGFFSDSKQLEELEQELLKNREELRTAREEMQAAQEELKSTNEELQSTNEELQSTNEELTTSKEEMQSINEELLSVNAEQEGRLDAFMQISNDMENLLNSTEIVTVFLDSKLQIRRFTSGANRLFKLIPGDIGRPLADIVSNLDYPQLSDHVQDVLRKLISVENQITTNDGRWFLVRIMPYRTMDNMIDGVVITCSDISAAKKREDELREEILSLKALQVS